MKILYVDLQYDYGMAHRGPNVIGQIGFFEVFKKLGHNVEAFYYDEFLNNKIALQAKLLEKVAAVKPDLVYFNLFGEQFELQTLDEVRKTSKTINWFGDDQWRFESFSRKYAPHLTYVITTDMFALPKYHAIGVNNIFLSQWASLNHDISDSSGPPTYDHDVSFVGGSHSIRRWFISELEKSGIKVAAFGYGWPNGPLPLAKLIQLFQRTKVNLNLSNSTSLDLRYLLHNIKNPIVAWRSPKSSAQIKARNFEIPYYGGFQITDYVPTLESYFSIGEEITCYKDVDEAALLIKYYLENDDLREKIKRAGIGRARSSHSYFHRHKLIFEALKI